MGLTSRWWHRLIGGRDVLPDEQGSQGDDHGVDAGDQGSGDAGDLVGHEQQDDGLDSPSDSGDLDRPSAQGDDASQHGSDDSLDSSSLPSGEVQPKSNNKRKN